MAKRKPGKPRRSPPEAPTCTPTDTRPAADTRQGTVDPSAFRVSRRFLHVTKKEDARLAAANRWLTENYDKAVEFARQNTRRLIGRDSL